MAAILKYAGVLRDPTADRAAKAEALRFLAHFVADVHQPLHVSHAHDKGGNDVKVFFFNQNTDLHKVVSVRCLGHFWRGGRVPAV